MPAFTAAWFELQKGNESEAYNLTESLSNWKIELPIPLTSVSSWASSSMMHT